MTNMKKYEKTHTKISDSVCKDLRLYDLVEKKLIVMLCCFDFG